MKSENLIQVRFMDYEAQHRNKMLTTRLQFLHLLFPQFIISLHLLLQCQNLQILSSVSCSMSIRVYLQGNSTILTPVCSTLSDIILHQQQGKKVER